MTTETLTPAREAELRDRAAKNRWHGHWRVMLPSADLEDLLLEIDRLRSHLRAYREDERDERERG